MVTKEVQKETRTKKSNHEGSYTERKDGTWMGRIAIDGIPFCCYGKSEAEVKRKVKEHRKKVIRDGNIIKRMTVNDWIEEWLKVNKKPKIGESSYSRLLVTYKNQFKGVEEGRILLRKQLDNVTMNDVQILINKLEETLSPSTVKKAHNFLSDAFNVAVDNQYMISNTALLARRRKEKYYKVKSKEKHILKAEDIELFVKEAMCKCKNEKTKHQYGAGMILQLFTGCRSGELRALTWDNVDFENKLLSIRHSVASVIDDSENAAKKTKIYISDTKSESSVRDVPLNNVAIECLQELKSRTDRFNNELNLVLPTTKGWYLTSGNYNKYIKVVLDNIGIQGMPSHSLRHTFASILINDEGCEIASVSRIMGHSKLEVTLGYAKHTDEFKKAETIKVLDRLAKKSAIA